MTTTVEHHAQTRILHSSAYSKAELEVLKHLSADIDSAREIGYAMWDKYTCALPAMTIIARLVRMGLVERAFFHFGATRYRLTARGKTIMQTL
jgi:hypothetical protein